MTKLIQFLDELEKSRIYYKLNKIRDSILVEVSVPGQRWEVEFFDDDSIEIEIFKSDGSIFDESMLSMLFKDFSNWDHLFWVTGF